jgi:hexosaminidase
MNNQLHIQSNDIIHWWGGGLPQTTNKVVISNYGPYYLDMGVGNYYGVAYGRYITWLEFYNRNLKKEITGYKNKDNVLGAEACLWSEISNQFVHHIKIWMRTSSLAERLWNSNIQTIKPGVLRRLAKQERLMNRKGIATAPVTCQQCETNSTYC